MPLSAKARVEVYLPDFPRANYQELLNTLRREFTYTFGGCTIVGGLEGSYLSYSGRHVQDRINLIYTDTPYTFEANFDIVATYADTLRAVAFAALEEDTILVAVMKTYHAD